MIIHELLNAVTMVFPLKIWWRTKNVLNKLKRRSILHFVMLFHIPISFLLHFTKAIKAKPKICKTFFCLDILCIHISSIVASRDLCRNIKASLFRISSLVLHIYTFTHSIIKYDLPTLRFFMFFYDNFKLVTDMKIVTNGLMSFIVYRISLLSKFVIGHSVFHVLLYNVYEEYFNIYYRSLQVQKHLPKQVLTSSPKHHPS